MEPGPFLLPAAPTGGADGAAGADEPDGAGMASNCSFRLKPGAWSVKTGERPPAPAPLMASSLCLLLVGLSCPEQCPGALGFLVLPQIWHVSEVIGSTR